jgi:hypothetical protein
VHPQFWLRSLGVTAATILLTACGSSSPAGPTGTGTTPAATANQVLRITFPGLCKPVNGDLLSLPPLIYSRVLLRQDGSEWVGTASSPAAGDVELRFGQSFGPPGAGITVTGTIKGTVRHMPEVVPTLPAWESEVNFGTDGGTLTGLPVGGGSTITPTTSFDGTGKGTVTAHSSIGAACVSSAFSWGLSAQS